ncbi:MAG: GIY-YIG nuclease family protein [Patescibacteria group bacterium]
MIRWRSGLIPQSGTLLRRARQNKKMFYVYVLKSKLTGKIYVGYSTDLKKRLTDHNRGKTRSTKDQRPWFLVYYEAYQDATDARKREASLKKNHAAKADLKRRIRSSLKSMV